MGQPNAVAPASRGALPIRAAFVVAAAVCAFSLYANFSLMVTERANYRYFPPFRSYADFNMNDHLGAEYCNVAQALAAGDGFADPFRDPTGPTAWMPPALPTFLAALLWAFDGNRQAVMAVVVCLQLLTLIGTGLLVLALVRQTSARFGTGVAAAVFVVGAMFDFFLLFQFTHDIWLVLAALDLMIVGLSWCRPLDNRIRAAGWGSFGGLCALVNPILVLTWCAVTLMLAVRQRAWIRFGIAAALASLMILPWTVRNHVVFGRWIPVKSNLAYELYQSQCLTPDGLIQVDTFAVHPYTGPNRERLEYNERGEIAYLDRKAELFWASVRESPMNFLARAGNRFAAATVWYVPFDRPEEARIPGWVWLRRVVHPLPFLGLLALVLTSRRQRLHPVQWAVIALYVVYLLPYAGISYYDRYAVPILGLKVLLVVWGADRLWSSWSKGGSVAAVSRPVSLKAACAVRNARSSNGQTICAEAHTTGPSSQSAILSGESSVYKHRGAFRDDD
jgi:hypothetical protein